MSAERVGAAGLSECGLLYQGLPGSGTPDAAPEQSEGAAPVQQHE